MCAQSVWYICWGEIRRLSNFSFYKLTAPVDQGSFRKKHVIGHWDVTHCGVKPFWENTLNLKMMYLKWLWFRSDVLIKYKVIIVSIVPTVLLYFLVFELKVDQIKRSIQKSLTIRTLISKQNYPLPIYTPCTYVVTLSYNL